ncbi:hypothetical protein DFP72DRAFT_921304 [Ephemerocybe angulata]|uniref:Uncharacterized protein n=1 Tax=Ephemerocybe angulata TaxID=980116 RepID=A0A8H6M026_9AGAR|nr:hypothetical protein DFP72DRAFT_921304 [Tulosesus angulatus]
MLFSRALSILSILSVSLSSVRAIPVAASTLADDPFHLVWCTITVQEVGDEPFPADFDYLWEFNLITIMALARASPNNGSYLFGPDAPEGHDEEKRTWTFRNGGRGSGMTLDESQAVLEALKGKVTHENKRDWLVLDVKDCTQDKRIGHVSLYSLKP